MCGQVSPSPSKSSLLATSTTSAVQSCSRRSPSCPSTTQPGPRVIAFRGGTIGNSEPAQRASFLARVANLLGPDDRFLLGTDLVKSREVLEAAYNDSDGVTADFNKNVLSVLNRELGADFDLDAFEHVAFWDDENLWVDIRLRSLARQVIHISALDISVAFGRGEEMRTEISTKFARDGLAGVYAEGGLRMVEWGADPRGRASRRSARRSRASGRTPRTRARWRRRRT